MGALLVANPDVFTTLKFAGAAYLLWLGFHQFRLARNSRANNSRYVPLERTPVLWVRSFIVGISNPKAILFFSAVLPQFVGNPQDSHIGPLLFLILLFVLVKLLVSGAYALTAKTMAKRLAKPGAAAWGKRVTGSVLMAFGMLLGVNAFG